MSQRLCVGGPVPSQIMCAGKDALLRVEASIIARRYTYYCGVPRHSLSTLHSGTTASFHLPGLSIRSSAIVLAAASSLFGSIHFGEGATVISAFTTRPFAMRAQDSSTSTRIFAIARCPTAVT